MTRGLSGLLGAMACVLVLAASVASLAPETARADLNDEARFYFERANELLQSASHARGTRRRGLLRDAVAQYLEAIRRVRSKNAIYNLALCYEQLDEPGSAWSYFHEYRSMEGVTEDERTDADGHLSALAPRIALVEVVSQPPGAEVRVDRPDLAALGVTPLTFPIEPGTHRVLLTLSGRRPAQVSVEAVRGERHRESVTLGAIEGELVLRTVPDGATVIVDGHGVGRTPFRGRLAIGRHTLVVEIGGRRSAPRAIQIREDRPLTLTARIPVTPVETFEGPAGTLSVLSNVGDAQIEIDGAARATGEAQEVRVRPGSHRVSVSAPGWHPYTGHVRVVQGVPTVLRVTLVLDSGTRRMGAWPYVTAGAAGIALVSAIVVSVMATSPNDELDGLRADAQRDGGLRAEQYARARTLVDTIDHRNTAGDVAWVTTGVLGGLSVLLFAVDGPSAEHPSTGQVVGLAPIPGGVLSTLWIPLGSGGSRARRSSGARTRSSDR